jgi:hypothetical protein
MLEMSCRRAVLAPTMSPDRFLAHYAPDLEIRLWDFKRFGNADRPPMASRFDFALGTLWHGFLPTCVSA